MKDILRLLTVLFCTCFSRTSNATDYVFSGVGDWTSASNWTGGLMPPGPLTSGNTIIVTGTASIGAVCSNCSANTLLNNSGTIIVAPGGSVTLQDLTELMNIGSIVVNGTLINKTTLEIFEGSTITVSGLFINQKSIVNQGTITVNAGGKIENLQTASFLGINTPSAAGTLVVNNGGTVVNKNTAVLNPGKLVNNGTIDNQSIMSGEVVVTGNLTNSGILSPGNSIGTFSVSGNYTASSSSMHNFELGGPASHDKLNVNGTVNLSGILNVTLVNGFFPIGDHDLTIVTGNINGAFNAVFKPSKYMVVYNPNSVVLRYNNAQPMFYIKLDVKKEGATAKLSWEIHNEPAVVHYEVEKSLDGRTFDKIGTVNATMAGVYYFTDSHPREKNFYRIKVVDIGGIYRYSSVISLQQGKTSIALNVFPSPAQKDITIQHASANVDSKIVVSSMDGRIVKVSYPQRGTQQTTIDLFSIGGGSYILQFQNGSGQTESTMFTKQ